MITKTKAVILFVLSSMPCFPAHAQTADELYVSQAIVTGTGEKNRQPGFRDCLDRVLVRVSGDQRLVNRPEMNELRAKASNFVRGYTYRDRLAGKPIHDEQGTHDRPHDLTCLYDKDVVNGILAKLGSRPWLGKRPVLAVFLQVKRDQQDYWVNNHDIRDEAMREAFSQAASPMAIKVVFPSFNDTVAPGSDLDRRKEMMLLKADTALVGLLKWSETDLGWVVTWHLGFEEGGKQWQARGINFDEAFRVGVRGASQILSGNGQP